MSKVFEVLKRLDDAKVHYFIGRYRPDTIDITATVVGERVEISVFDDDHVEVSRFSATRTFWTKTFWTKS
ncbi:hypothetical protein ACC778_02675 [Rhizobium ruizarguesonis]|jgi:hypothetical protein|uniref:hypothetical protein n=1 Tax=Rhizobium TaxID=379 RepID=UPI001FE07605|nr:MULTISPECIES: hypothetical protein [Rhizobium]